MKKVIVILLLVLGVSIFSGCEISEYELLNKVIDLNTNQSYTGYEMTISNVIGESTITLEIDRENDIVRYYESIIKLNEFESEEETSYETKEEFYQNDKRYYQKDGVWKREDKSFKVESLLEIKEEYFSEVEFNTSTERLTFTGKVKEEQTEVLLGKGCNDVTIIVVYNVSNQTLIQLSIGYTNDKGHKVDIITTINYQTITLELPTVE